MVISIATLNSLKVDLKFHVKLLGSPAAEWWKGQGAPLP